MEAISAKASLQGNTSALDQLVKPLDLLCENGLLG